MKENKYTIKYTNSFKKDYKRAIKRGLKIELLNKIITLLATGESLPYLISVVTMHYLEIGQVIENVIFYLTGYSFTT